MITTYDFVTKTFGHASMLVGGWTGQTTEGALAELTAARNRLTEEQAKADRGEPYDFEFIYGFPYDGTMKVWPDPPDPRETT